MIHNDHEHKQSTGLPLSRVVIGRCLHSKSTFYAAQHSLSVWNKNNSWHEKNNNKKNAPQCVKASTLRKQIIIFWVAVKNEVFWASPSQVPSKKQMPKNSPLKQGSWRQHIGCKFKGPHLLLLFFCFFHVSAHKLLHLPLMFPCSVGAWHHLCVQVTHGWRRSRRCSDKHPAGVVAECWASSEKWFIVFTPWS